jgi:Putative Actinobacterial Holin-X, holin superfamily III
VTEYPPGETPRPDVDAVPISTLVSQLTEDVSRLVRQEVELAKTEVRREASKAGKAAGMLSGAGVGGHLLLVFLSLAAMFGLGAVMPLGWAALIVAAFWAIVAAALFVTGRNRLRTVSPVPEQTVETVKEDVRWAKTRTS